MGFDVSDIVVSEGLLNGFNGMTSAMKLLM
jgi:hypothetical protein